MSNRAPMWSAVALLLILFDGLSEGAEAMRQMGPWLHFGPVVLDVTKEYEHLQIYGLDRAGAKLRPAQEEDAARFAAVVPAEGDGGALFGADSQWKLLRVQPPAKLATWAQFGRFPVLLANALQTTISSPQRRVRVAFEIAGGARIYLNGTRVHSFDWPSGRYSQRRRHEVDLELREGDNNLVVVIFAVHLHAANAFRAEAPVSLQARVKWHDREGIRGEIEKDLERTYAGPWLSRSGEDVIRAGVAGSPSRFAISFRSDRWTRVLPAGSREIVLGKAQDAIRTRTTIRAFARTQEGLEVAGPEFVLQVAGSPPTVAAGLDYAQRRQYILKRAADSAAPARRALACAALGQKVAPADLAEALAHINNRIDTADFTFHDLIRLYYQFPEALDVPARDAIRNAALGWKYWMDEPGPSSMFMKSENHQILFHTLQYMTGTLFAGSTFREIGAPGTVQALKGRILAGEWMEERRRYGFEEWLAPGYLEKDVQALLNVVDLPGGDERMAASARSVLDLIFTYLCSHEWGGYMHTTAGRAYMREVTTPYMQHVASLIWLLTGKGAAEVDSGALALALSGYRPPAAILALSAPEAPALTYTQQGRNRNGAGVRTATLRSRDAVLSTTLDYNKGAAGAQAHVVQATLTGGVPVFINSAISTSETTRPGYWLGNTELPRAFQHGETAIVLYRLKDPIAFTHCFFPVPWMDRHLVRNGWIAGQRGDGYVAVYSQSGSALSSSGPYRDFEIVSAARENFWVIRTGSRQSYPTLDAFAAALPEPAIQNGVVSAGSLTASWDGDLKDNGAVVPLSGLPMIGNDWVKSVYGSGVITIAQPGSPEIVISR